MPCNSDYDDRRYSDDVRREVTRATRVACELAKLLKKDGVLFNKISPRTKRWIKKHDALDRARALAEEKEKDKVRIANKIRIKALAKLSAKEKAVLGLPDHSPTDDE